MQSTFTYQHLQTTDLRVSLTVVLPTMTLNQRLILILLLGLTVSSEVATSLCVLDMTRCVCKVMAIHNPQGLRCFEALELELRDGKLDISSEMITGMYPNVISLIRMDKLIFNNVTISSSFISAVIPFLPISSLRKINIISFTLKGVQPLKDPESPSKIKTLLLEDVRVDPVLLQPSFQQWLFGSLRSLALVHCGLVEIDCSWAQTVENLAQLDLSENSISFTSLQNISHCPSLLFKYLQSLHLRRSNLTSLQSLCTLLSLTPALTVLHVSRNNFSIVHYPQCLQLKPLRMLNLSHSGITEIHLLNSTSLEELDLSYNSLEAFNNPPLTLKKLNLSHNRLIRHPSLGHLSPLQDLNVDSNQFTILMNETSVVLNGTDGGSLVVFPEGLLCASPVDQQGTPIMNLSLETCVKPTSGTQRNDSPLCLTLFVGFVSYLVYLC